jgi:hypothetical protein
MAPIITETPLCSLHRLLIPVLIFDLLRGE